MCRCQWTKTTTEVFETGGFKGFRWSDGENTPHLPLHNPAEAQILDVGTRIELHDNQCHPALLTGWILTGTGILCAVTGFILIMP